MSATQTTEKPKLPEGKCYECGVPLFSPRAVGMCPRCGEAYWAAHPVADDPDECPHCGGTGKRSSL